jgi:hypothetical protein
MFERARKRVFPPLLRCALALCALAICHAQYLRAQDSSRTAQHGGHRILGVFDAISGAPLDAVDVIDLFVDDVYRTSASGLVGLWAFHSRHDSAAVRVRKVGYRDTSFVVMVAASDTLPISIFLEHATALSRSNLKTTAQTGISGLVVVDSSNEPIAGATVSVLDVGRTVFTNFDGEFRLPTVAPGRHVLDIRRIGYAPAHDSVLVPASGGLTVTAQLNRLPVLLDSVSVRAARPTSSYLDEFYSRRKMGLGHFIDSVELRKAGDNRGFATYIAGRIPGLRVKLKKGAGDVTYLTSSRAQCSGRAFTCNGMTACPISLYVDGLPVFVPNYTGGGPPDLDDYRLEEYAAVEFYAGGATVPEQYNVTGSSCGVMLLWRRR